MATRDSHSLSDGSDVSAHSGLLMGHLAALAHATAAFYACVHILWDGSAVFDVSVNPIQSIIYYFTKWTMLF
jgi:hypothetical protein